MSVQKLPVKVRVSLNLGGPGLRNNPTMDDDLSWVQDATLLIDMQPPVKPVTKESKEHAQ